jgi:hypothetical protein
MVRVKLLWCHERVPGCAVDLTGETEAATPRRAAPTASAAPPAARAGSKIVICASCGATAPAALARVPVWQAWV